MYSPEKNIKVCFVSPKVYPLFNTQVEGVFGGAEVDLYYLGTELANDLRYTVSYIAADYSQPAYEVIEKVHIFKSLSFKESKLLAFVKIWRAMRRANADIYIFKNVSGILLVAMFCILNRKEFIYRTAHSTHCDGTYQIKHPIQGKIYEFCVRRSSHVFTQNRDDRDGLQRTMGVEATHVPNGHRIPPISEEARNTILWVGRSVDFKQPQLYLEMARQFVTEKFVMICQQATGDCAYERLIEEASQIPNLEFMERVLFKDVDVYFRRAKLFVNTSESEGFPNTFIQSCKAATPILSLTVNPDRFLDCHGCGVCAEGDWDRFMEGARYLLTHNRGREYGDRGRAYVCKYHNVTNTVELYKTVFETIMYKG